jgi:transketolase C-terminal domain/subunit
MVIPTFELIADSALIMSTHYLETEIPQRIMTAGIAANLI